MTGTQFDTVKLCEQTNNQFLYEFPFVELVYCPLTSTGKFLSLLLVLFSSAYVTKLKYLLYLICVRWR